MHECPICHTPYGKRRRCYQCQPGKRKTGETRECANCGDGFYAQQCQIKDTARRSATFCSRECKHEAQSERPGFTARPNELITHSAGYLLAWAPDHPRANRGRVQQHVLIAERTLGRHLERDEIVHHIDHDRTNNDPANLRVMTNSEHSKMHSEQRSAHARSLWPKITCPVCAATFAISPYRSVSADPRSRAKYCSTHCRLVGMRRAHSEKAAQRRQLKE